MSIRKLLTQNFLFIILIIILSLFYDRSLMLLVSVKSLIIVIISVIIFIGFNYNIDKGLKYFKIALNKKKYENDDLLSAIHFFDVLSIYSFIFSVLVSIAMTSYLLGYIKDIPTIGQFLEIIILTPTYVLYGILMINIPLRISLKNKLNEEEF